MDRLRGVRLKIERAKKHILDLDRMMESFREHAYTIGRKSHPVAEINHLTLYVKSVAPIPDPMPLIIGDAVHNLRTALDHLVYQLVEANGGIVGNRTEFPIFQYRQESPGQDTTPSLKGKIKGMNAAAAELIKKIQPYATNDLTLWNLRELDNRDKHRLLLTLIASMDKWTFDVGKGTFIPWNMSRFIPLEVGYEIVNIPAATLERYPNSDIQLGIHIAFNEPEIAKLEPVLGTLNHTANFVEGIINQFEGFLV